jgi:hypothetical protein
MCTNAKHTPHDNGGAAGDWKVFSIHPPLRGAMALNEMLRMNWSVFPDVR